VPEDDPLSADPQQTVDLTDEVRLAALNAVFAG